MSWYRIKQFTSLTVTGLLLVMSLAAVYMLAQGAKFLSVQSGSMVPTYNKGDLVVDMRVPARQLAVGDVVTYTNPQLYNGQPITHRIVQTPSEFNNQSYITKGDANKANDPPIKAHNIIGEVRYSVPLLGYLFDFVRKPIGLAMLVYIPALTVIAAELRRLIKHYKSQEPYVASGYDPEHAVKQKTTGTNGTISSFAKVSSLAVVGVTLLGVATVQAARLSTVTLTDTSLRTVTAPNPNPNPPAPTPGTPLIHKVSFTGSNGSSSSNSTNNTNVSVNNSQNVTTGNATSSGGTATSGNASATSNTSVTINSSNGSASGTTPAQNFQSVTIYNPTDQAINLAGWKLTDNNGTQTIPAGSTVAAKGYFTFTWPAANGLDCLGDRLILQNAAGNSIDSLSWGTDASQLNPAIPSGSTINSLTRKTPGLDSGTAADWLAS